MISKSLVSAPYIPFLTVVFFEKKRHSYVRLFKQCIISFYPDINKGV